MSFSTGILNPANKDLQNLLVLIPRLGRDTASLMNLGSELTDIISFMGDVLPSAGDFALVSCRATFYPAHAAHQVFLSFLFHLF